MEIDISCVLLRAILRVRKVGRSGIQNFFFVEYACDRLACTVRLTPFLLCLQNWHEYFG